MTALDAAPREAPRPWWMEEAACRGKSDLFFPPPGERPAARENRENRARQVCLSCVALSACQTFARSERELGFWGGESESERAAAGFAPTTPIIGRRKVAETRAAAALGRTVR